MGILDKKFVLITGTGGGLGRVAAQTFAREGAKHRTLRSNQSLNTIQDYVTYLGSESRDRIALANKIAGRQPTEFSTWARLNVPVQNP